MTNMLASALALAARQMQVFPCYANKKTPITKNGFKQATADTAVINAWWQAYPTANIAVATGAVSSIIVLDVDMKHGKDGEASLAELERKHGPLPPTVEAITPSKGRHLWFKHPGRAVPCSVDQIGAGLDIRADLGYVLVAPSYVIEPEYRGSYTWSVDSASTLADMPQWLLGLPAVSGKEPKPAGYFADIANGVPDGQRNASLASLCGKLLRADLTPSQTFEYLTFWNTKNNPPLEATVIENAVRNIASREILRRKQ